MFSVTQVLNILKTKFTAKTMRLFDEWKTDARRPGLKTIADLSAFIRSQKNFQFDSAEAKSQLHRQKQFKLKLGVREFWDHLKEIEARVSEKDRSQPEFIRAFIDGLDTTFQSRVLGDYNMYFMEKRSHPGKEWFIIKAESEQRNAEHLGKFQNRPAPFVPRPAPAVVAAVAQAQAHPDLRSLELFLKIRSEGLTGEGPSIRR